MKRTLATIILLLAFSTLTLADNSKLSDNQIKQLIIQKSTAAYPGNCPCPFNRASNGSRCGKRSAWSRVGGYSPICYSDEVSDEQVTKYRAGH